MTGTFRIAGILLAECAGALIFDYCCYYQATIFTSLDHSRKGMDGNYRDPPYHPLPHAVLWLLMPIFVIPVFWLLAFNEGNEISAWISAIGIGAYFYTRYILMRRGIS